MARGTGAQAQAQPYSASRVPRGRSRRGRRKHNAFSDGDGDPHSPHAGFGDTLLGRFLGLWHAHMGWLFSTKGLERGRHYGRDLYEGAMIRWIDRLYLLWVAAAIGIAFLAGRLAGGTAMRGVECLVWAGLVRVFLFQHVTDESR